MKLNRNDQAVRITKAEGGKVSIPIGQVKEVMRLHLEDLALFCDAEILRVINRARCAMTKREMGRGANRARRTDRR